MLAALPCTFGLAAVVFFALGFLAMTVPSAATLEAAAFLGVFVVLALGLTTFFFFCNAIGRYKISNKRLVMH